MPSSVVNFVVTQSWKANQAGSDKEQPEVSRVAPQWLAVNVSEVFLGLGGIISARFQRVSFSI